MSKKIIPAPTLSDFDKQYLTDRGQNWRDYIIAEPEVADEAEKPEEPPVDEKPADDETPEEPAADEAEDDEDVPYTEWANDELRAEIHRRNETRDEDARMSSKGKKVDLIAVLEADDAASAADDADDNDETADQDA